MERRVKQFAALQEKMGRKLKACKLTEGDFHLFIRAFKASRQLEVWVKPARSERWSPFDSYPFCETSGQLGPKRKEGDRQIPEGIYFIDRFNPKSKYHLSLGLNYPNRSDQLLGHPETPGSDIFIHGGCESVGCIPITDAGIEEVYLLASWAKENGQEKIPVHIYPFIFQMENWSKFGPEWPQHHFFWKELEAIYQAFEASKVMPEFIISGDGHYQVRP